MQAVCRMMKVFGYAVSPVRLTAKSEDNHNIDTSGCHTNYIVQQNLSIIKYF
jgi:hypothetical protein